jgi:hypothetical protein
MNIKVINKIGSRIAPPAGMIAGLFATAFLSGCGLTNTRIDATDNRVVMPSMRAAINFNDGKQAASEPQSGHAIEISGMKTRGSDMQTLASGQNNITYGSSTFTAPVQLQNDFDVEYADVSWRMRKFFDERALGIEVSAGGGYSRLDMTLFSASQSANHQLVSRGIQGGFGVIWRFNQRSSLQGRIGAFVASKNEGITQITRSEIVYAISLLDNVSIRAGYAGWEAYGQTPNYGSDFKLNFAGPVLSLNWDFNVNNPKIRVNRDDKSVPPVSQ